MIFWYEYCFYFIKVGVFQKPPVKDPRFSIEVALS